MALGCGDSGGADKTGSEDGGSGKTDASASGDGDSAGDGDSGDGDSGDGDSGDGDVGGDKDAGTMDGGGDGDGDSGSGDPDAGPDASDMLDPQSTACTAFPATITLGPTIQIGSFGAVLCVDSATDHCRLTTNTYSDGENPCPYGRHAASFFSDGAYHTLSVPSFMNDWEIVSISHGDFHAHQIAGLPGNEPITAVVKAGAAGPEYTVVFQFNGAQSFTLTSFEQN